MWSNGALHPSSKVGMDHPALFDSGGVRATGKHDEKTHRQAGQNAYLAGASCAGDSPTQLKSERGTGFVMESGTDDSKDNATPQRDDGLANDDARSDAGESSALILTQGTNSPRGTSSSLDLSMEREYGKHSGMGLVAGFSLGERSSFTKPWARVRTVIECHGVRLPALPQPRRLGEQYGSCEHFSPQQACLSVMRGNPRHFPFLEGGARPGRRSLICKMVTARSQQH